MAPKHTTTGPQEHYPIISSVAPTHTTDGPHRSEYSHTRRGDKYVTVIIDLTPISQGTGPARLLDMVPGRSKQVFKQWLAARPKDWRDGRQDRAMDGFSGFKTAAAEELPDAVEVMDPFHVVKLAGDALDDVRRRVQQETTGHRGHELRIRCIGQGGRCTRARTCSQGGSKNGLSVSLLMRTSPKSKSPGPSIKTSWLLTGLRTVAKARGSCRLSSMPCRQDCLLD